MAESMDQKQSDTPELKKEETAVATKPDEAGAVQADASASRSAPGFFQYGEGVASGEKYEPSGDEVRRRKRRNAAIALGLVAFIVMVYLITMIRLGINVQSGV